ncbi:Uncharacterised protein [Escherichia coli]|uniref:Uncharacterized protein n=1 Tax=Escherichia coli TaxID=562 RepID=A0A376L3N3_ECOLX|nr:Uncharacterised protein [Escherichia coli]
MNALIRPTKARIFNILQRFRRLDKRSASGNFAFKLPDKPGVWSRLFPLLQETLTVLVGYQQSGVNLIWRRAARHVVNGFTFCTCRFCHNSHFRRDIFFNIQLSESYWQTYRMAKCSYGFDFLNRCVFQNQLASAYQMPLFHRDNSDARPG